MTQPKPEDDPETPASRLAAELSLLEAMYPSSVTFVSRSRDLRYTCASTPSRTKESLVLRLPEGYPVCGRPELISAGEGDLRSETRQAIQALDDGGGEVLDQIIEAFEMLVEERRSHKQPGPADGEVDDEAANKKEKEKQLSSTTAAMVTGQPHRHPTPAALKKKTVIIWLHHLLATSKRKLAVSPAGAATISSSSSATTTALAPTATPTDRSTSTSTSQSTRPSISGLTKPGYPGILIYSGDSDVVDEHVRALKAQNWQAFRAVRLDRRATATAWPKRTGRRRRRMDVLPRPRKDHRSRNHGGSGQGPCAAGR